MRGAWLAILLDTYRRGAKRDVQSTPSYEYSPSSSGPTTYAKTALWLHTMERWLGWRTLQRIMSTYFARWRFKHPRPNDFFDAVAAATGTDLGWYFDQTYRSSNVFDYGVEELRTARDGAQYRTTAIVRRYGEATFPVVDPNRVLLLDVNWTNNSKTLEPQGARASTRWSLRWMIWLEDALLSWAALA